MIVVDTNVISEAMSISPNDVVLRWLSAHSGEELFTTSISLAEVFYGIELLPIGKRRNTLLASAEAMFIGLFPDRVLGFDEAAARAFSPINADRRLRGKPISLFDAQIAAIVRANGAILATRNISDFEGCRIRLVNPWVG